MKIKYIAIFLVLLCCFMGAASAAEDISADVVSDSVDDAVTIDAVSEGISDSVTADPVSEDTITEEITYNEDTNKLTVKLNPLFEHLRQIKLHKNESFSADLETLSGTFEKRSDSAKQTLKNDEQNLSNVVMIGTRISAINTEIEPNFDGSKKQNVDGGTCLARSRLTGLRFFFSETLKGDSSPTQLHNNKDTDISQYLFYMSLLCQ